MKLNKNISDLVFILSVIAIPKTPLYQDLSLTPLFTDFSGSLTGPSRVTELHLPFSDHNCRQILLSKLTLKFWSSPWTHGLTEVWRKRYNTDEIYYLVQVSHTFFLSVFNLLRMPVKQWHICIWGALDYTNSLCFFSVFPFSRIRHST